MADNWTAERPKVGGRYYVRPLGSIALAIGVISDGFLYVRGRSVTSPYEYGPRIPSPDELAAMERVILETGAILLLEYGNEARGNWGDLFKVYDAIKGGEDND